MVKMEVVSVDEDKRKKHLTNVILTVVLFIGIFSFVYWFVAFPIVWSNMPSAHWKSFWFNFYCLIAFFIWLVIVLFALFLLWYYKNKFFPVVSQKRPYYSVSPANNESVKEGNFNNSPPYVTELVRVQPGDKDMSMQAKELLIKLENSSNDNIVLSNDSSQIIDSPESPHLQTETDVGKMCCDKPVLRNMEEEHKDSVFKNDVKPVTSEVKGSVVLRNKEKLAIDTSHKVQSGSDEADTPKSPREVFFWDLIKQSDEHNKKPEQTGPERSSYCSGKDAKMSSNTKSRKSVPLYFHISPYGTDLYSMNEKPLENNPPVDTTVHPPHVEETGARIVAENLKDNVASKHKLGSDNATRTSMSEYFIANISRPKSVTSEVHLFISGDDKNKTGHMEPCEWMFGEGSEDTHENEQLLMNKSKKQETDDTLSDDCVFY